MPVGIRELLDTATRTGCSCAECRSKIRRELAERVEAVLRVIAAETPSDLNAHESVGWDRAMESAIRALEGEP